ncbi:MAG: hypothetical protein ACK4RK_03645 [Gemmataceae bacterium]
MKTEKFHVYVVVALVGVPAFVKAGEPVLAQPLSGRVLLLANDRILEGDITRMGDRYRIRRTIGETWIPASDVRCLSADMEGIYRYLRQQANLQDADERLRLTRWCMRHGLREQARVEAEAAAELRPHDAECRRLFEYLKHSTTTARSAPSQETRQEFPDLPSVEYNPQALGLFTTKVQPLLMNTCARCHASDNGGAFRLTRVHATSAVDRRLTIHNLAATMRYVDRERPGQSELLAKAVAIHGGADLPPLKNRESAAYRLLEEWVHLAAAHGRPAATAAAPPVFILPTPPAASVPLSMSSAPEPVSTEAVEPTMIEESELATGAAQTATMAPPSAASVPAEPETPLDPFDPIIFNRQMHPHGKPKPAP